MKINLKELKPNPMRNLAVDPIDTKRVDAVAKSIGKDGFWGGVVIGNLNGSGQVILAGHTRVKAALKHGITHADLFVTENPAPDIMLRIYATENATQRGDDNTSIAGTIAGAIKIIATRMSSRETTRTGCRADIGEPAVTDFLAGYPGIDRNVVKQQIANLKASGDYDKIIHAAYRELGIKHDTKAAEPTFDLAGVQKHLHRPEHVQTFRKEVTGKTLLGVLAVENQAELAAAIVDALPVNEDGDRAELTSKFIREALYHQLITARGFVNARDKAALRAANVADQATHLEHDFARHIASARADLVKLKELAAENDMKLRFTPEFETAMEDVQQLATKLIPQVKRIGHGPQAEG